MDESWTPADFYAGKTALITGAAGFVGTAIAARLAGSHCRIRRQSRRAFATPTPPNGEDMVADFGSQEACDRLLDGVDVVFHCAAQTSVYQAEADPLGDLAANVAAPLRLLEAAKRSGRRVTLVMAGTATTAGMVTELPVRAGTPPRPVTIYDASKLATEGYVSLYARLGHVQGCVLRLSNVFGPDPGSQAADRGILNKVLRRALDGLPITVFGDGAWVRDYVFIDDVAAAFVRAGAAGEALGGEPYFVCSGEGTTVADAFRAAAEVAASRTGRAVEIQSVAPPDSLSIIEYRNFVGDWSALNRVCGWRPVTSLRRGLELTADAFLSKA